jgi:hypothetical protein
MAQYGLSITLEYTAWDTTNQCGKTGDASNHTLRWIKDGSAAAPTNSPSEVDSTNCPGTYKLTLTATECQCDVGRLAGKSSSSGIIIVPLDVSFHRFPANFADLAIIASVGRIDVGKWLGATVDSGSESGLPKVDAEAIADSASAASGISSRISNLDAAVSSRSTLTAEQVWEYATRTLTDLSNLASAIENMISETVTNVFTNISIDETVVNTFFEKTGITVGGTWTFGKILRILAAWMVGNWQVKSGTVNTYQVSDAENPDAVVLEVTPNQETPQKQVSVL